MSFLELTDDIELQEDDPTPDEQAKLRATSEKARKTLSDEFPMMQTPDLWSYKSTLNKTDGE